MGRKIRKERFVEPAEEVLKGVRVVGPDGRTSPSPQTAAEAYELAAASVAYRLRQLETLLADHRKRFEGTPGMEGKDWGFAGDLNRIDALLKQALGEDD